MNLKQFCSENQLVVVRGRGWGVEEMDEGSQKVQTSSYEMSKSWVCKVQRSNYS